MFFLLIAASAAASSSVPATHSVDVAMPTIIIDTRYTGCSVDEQPYYFRGKAERRAEKVEAVLQAEGVEYRVLRWSKDADVPSAEVIRALGPKKYLRNC